MGASPQVKTGEVTDANLVPPSRGHQAARVDSGGAMPPPIPARPPSLPARPIRDPNTGGHETGSASSSSGSSAASHSINSSNNILRGDRDILGETGAGAGALSSSSKAGNDPEVGDRDFIAAYNSYQRGGSATGRAMETDSKDASATVSYQTSKTGSSAWFGCEPNGFVVKISGDRCSTHFS